MKSLTVLEETVLLAIYRLKDGAYSVTIQLKILEMAGKDIIIGTLFNVLKQLHRKGYVQKRKGTPLREKGGKSVMFYRVSEKGLEALEQTRKMHDRIWADVNEVLYKGS